MKRITYRWEGPEDEAPMHGCYLLAPHRPRQGYLIHSVENRGPRGGLGRPVFILLILQCDRVPVEEARAAGDRCYCIVWDKRPPRAVR